ncbi:MAG: flagellar biosynthesis protein FlaG [Epsilonproteobacteria bacterium]|nr:flagellar biosynthesis protein FlaG [Campylobacterota bacterium]
MDIFSATSKQIDTTQRFGSEYAKTQQAVSSNSPTTNSEVRNEREMKEIQKNLDNTVKKLNDQMDALSVNIRFGFNDKIDSMYVDVTEKSTGKLIRKIPSEETMKIAEKMKEIIGMIFDKKG